jgi:hypothetical protein
MIYKNILERNKNYNMVLVNSSRCPSPHVARARCLKLAACGQSTMLEADPFSSEEP